jgi:hypothetical protein
VAKKKTKKKPFCKTHNYRVAAYWGDDTMSVRCTRCDDDILVHLTKGETRTNRALRKREHKEIGDVHKCYHEFLRRFCEKDDDAVFKYKGYDLMQRVERWAKRWSHDVQLVHCDDDYHAGSLLVLIQHQQPHDYMGCTVVFIPQCTGEAPIRFFLYNDDRDSLIKALDVVRKQARVKRPRSPVAVKRAQFDKSIEARIRKKDRTRCAACGKKLKDEFDGDRCYKCDDTICTGCIAHFLAANAICKRCAAS